MEGSFLFMQYFEMLRSGNSAKINEAEKLKEKFDKLYRFDQFLFHSSIIFDNSLIFLSPCTELVQSGKVKQKGLFHTRESQGKLRDLKTSRKNLGNWKKFC